MAMMRNTLLNQVTHKTDFDYLQLRKEDNKIYAKVTKLLEGYNDQME